MLERIHDSCNQMPGYLGKVIDYVQVNNNNFKPIVDLAVKAKLFSIIVDTMETAKEVIRVN